MAGIVTPTNNQGVSVLNQSGELIGQIATPLLRVDAVRFCQKCYEFEKQECSHEHKIRSLEGQVKSLEMEVDRKNNEYVFEVDFWRSRYIELFARISKATQCVGCGDRPEEAVLLTCGHQLCGVCFELDHAPGIGLICPRPHPESPGLGTLVVDGNPELVRSESARAIEDILKAEIRADDLITEPYQEIPVQEACLRRYFTNRSFAVVQSPTRTSSPVE